MLESVPLSFPVTPIKHSSWTVIVLGERDRDPWCIVLGGRVEGRGKEAALLVVALAFQGLQKQPGRVQRVGMRLAEGLRVAVPDLEARRIWATTSAPSCTDPPLQLKC